MSRETKVGLVVASSFICLVGVVVASKFRPGDSSAIAHTMVQPTAKDMGDKNAPAPFPKPDLKETPNAGTQPVDAPPPLRIAPGSQDGITRAGGIQENFGGPPPAAAVPNLINKINEQARSDRNGLTEVALNGGQPPPPGPAPAPAPVPAPSPAPIPPPSPSTEVPGVVDVQVRPVVPAPSAPLPPSPFAKPDAGKPSDAGLPIPAPPAPPAPMADPGPAPLSVPSGNGSNGPPPIAPAPAPITKEPLPPVPLPGLNSDNPPPAPLPIPIPTPSNKPGGDIKPSAPVPPPENVNPFKKPEPPAAVPALGTGPGPLGAAPGLTNNVKSYAVESYKIKQDETSLAAVSKNIWGSEKYAAALLQFNREYYPMTAKGLMQNPPQLEPGQKIHIPPADVLDALLSKAPSTLAPPAIGTPGGDPFGTPQGGTPPLGGTPPPLGAPAGPFATSPQPVAGNSPGGYQPAFGGTAPSPIGGIPPPIGAAPVVSLGPTNTSPSLTVRSATPTSDPTKRYTVPGQGLHIYQIAAQTLGDGRRWGEIYRLNPNVQPLNIIPGGTPLKLPANASVP